MYTKVSQKKLAWIDFFFDIINVRKIVKIYFVTFQQNYEQNELVFGYQNHLKIYSIITDVVEGLL